MDAKFAKRWVADLRDPAHKQCKSKLHDGSGYCCLGRAAILAGAKFVPMREEHWIGDPEYGMDRLHIITNKETFVIDGTQTEVEGEVDVNGEYECLTADICCSLDMRAVDGSVTAPDKIVIGGISYGSLALANDNGCTFAQIADWIEVNYERL